MKNVLLLGIFIILPIIAFQVLINGNEPTNINDLPKSTTGLTGDHSSLVSLDRGTKAGQLAPNIISTDVLGNKIELDKIVSEGKPSLVYFFATWCPYCKKDLTTLNEVYSEFSDDVTILAMDLDISEGSNQIKQYQQKYPGLEKINFLTGQTSTLAEYKVRSTTTKYAIDAQGKIVYSGSGAFSTDQWRSLLTTLKNTV